MHDKILLWIGLVIIGILIGLCWALFSAWFSAKKQVKNIPRVPFEICPIHGGYPSKYSMRTIAEGFDAPIEHCPFFLRERVAKKKVP